LLGHEVQRDFDTTAHALNGLPIQAGEWLVTGDPTDVNGDGALDFDGCEYREITGTIFGNLRYDSDDSSNPAIETSMTLLTLDVHSNAPNDTTDVGLNFFDENEQLISTAAHFTCWAEIEPTDLNPSLLASNPNWTERGLVRSTYATQYGKPVTLVGFIETKEGFTREIAVPELPVKLCDLVPTQVADKCTMVLGVKVCTLKTVMQSVCFNGTVLPNAVSVPGNRQYAYPLLNDGEPVPTTFIPR
jgi:hypothetical protein